MSVVNFFSKIYQHRFTTLWRKRPCWLSRSTGRRSQYGRRSCSIYVFWNKL